MDFMMSVVLLTIKKRLESSNVFIYYEINENMQMCELGKEIEIGFGIKYKTYKYITKKIFF